MGERKRRLAALDAGAPWPRRRVCPVRKCRSPRVHDIPADDGLVLRYASLTGGVPCLLRVCMDCGALWEPWPDDAPEDCVERTRSHGPCDNCAFRPGSPEQRDRGRWRELKQIVAGGIELQQWFCCHKGVPVDLHSMDFDYAAAGIDPEHQTCAGFLLALWSRQRSGGDA